MKDTLKRIAASILVALIVIGVPLSWPSGVFLIFAFLIAMLLFPIVDK